MYGKEYSLKNALTLEWYHFLKYYQILSPICQKKTNILRKILRQKKWLCEFVQAQGCVETNGLGCDNVFFLELTSNAGS